MEPAALGPWRPSVRLSAQRTNATSLPAAAAPAPHHLPEPSQLLSTLSLTLQTPDVQQPGTPAAPEPLQQQPGEVVDAASSVQLAVDIQSHNVDIGLSSPDAVAQCSETACSVGLHSPGAVAVATAPVFEGRAEPAFDGTS